MKIKNFIKTLAIASVCLTLVETAVAQTVMRVGSWRPPGNPNNAVVFPELNELKGV